MRRNHTIGEKAILLALALALVACGAAPDVGGFAAPRAALAESADEAALQQRYDDAKALADAQDYEKARELFEALGDFADSRAQANRCTRKLREARYAEAIDLFEAEQYAEARAIFESLDGYEKSRSYANDCTARIRRIEYQQAQALFDAGNYAEALPMFQSFGKYHDSEAYAEAAAQFLKEEAAYNDGAARLQAGDWVAARDAFIEAGDWLDATDQMYVAIRQIGLRKLYQQAESALADEDYETARTLYVLLEDYEDSAQKADEAQKAGLAAGYEQAAALQSADPARACIAYLALGEYEDSASLADALRADVTDEALYAAADALAQAGDLEQAKVDFDDRVAILYITPLMGDLARAKIGFEALASYSDSAARAEALGEELRQAEEYRRALWLRQLGETEQANALLESLGEYQNAALQVAPRFTAKQLRDDRTTPLSEIFTAPDGTKHQYCLYKGVPRWLEAKAMCELLGGHMATLTTAEENDFVHSYMWDSGHTTAFFGLSDEYRTGEWVWVTGEPFEYSNWHAREPSYSPRERYGMYFYKHKDGTWNDSHFYEYTEVDPGCSFICEWDL